MNVNLTPQLEEMVYKKVAFGFFNSASEVVRDALCLMDNKIVYTPLSLSS